jgi:DNA-binding response OmpR family regulator
MKATPGSAALVSMLTRRQRDVCAYLRTHSGETITREQLCRDVWGMAYFSSSRTIDQTISIVRKHLEQQEQIVTVFRIGYQHRFLTALAERDHCGNAARTG